MRRMFCKFCPQGPLDICKKCLPVFLNDLFYKIIRFFLVWMQSSVLYCKKAYNISISKKSFWILFLDSFNGWSEILTNGICNHVLLVIATVKRCIFAIGMWSSRKWMWPTLYRSGPWLKKMEDMEKQVAVCLDDILLVQIQRQLFYTFSTIFLKSDQILLS